MGKTTTTTEGKKLNGKENITGENVLKKKNHIGTSKYAK